MFETKPKYIVNTSEQMRALDTVLKLNLMIRNRMVHVPKYGGVVRPKDHEALAELYSTDYDAFLKNIFQYILNAEEYIQLPHMYDTKRYNLIIQSFNKKTSDLSKITPLQLSDAIYSLCWDLSKASVEKLKKLE